MFVFGHAGLTLGSAILLTGFRTRNRKLETCEKAGLEIPRASPSPPVSQEGVAATGGRRLMYLAGLVDIRVLLIGSILPDIIDKPIGRLFFQDFFYNGRIYAHTLLFFVILTAGGWLLYWARHKTWLLALAYGTFTHLIFDAMWTTPRTLLWPLYGLSFGKYPSSIWSWIEDLFHELYYRPWVLIPELVGALIIAWLVWQLARRRKLLALLKHGRI